MVFTCRFVFLKFWQATTLIANERVFPFRSLIRIGCGTQAGAARRNCDSTIFRKRASRRSASQPCAIDYRWPNHHRCTLVSLAIQEHRPICRCPKLGWRSLSALVIRKDVSRQRNLVNQKAQITKLPRYSSKGKPSQPWPVSVLVHRRRELHYSRLYRPEPCLRSNGYRNTDRF